uniref:Putative secreted protein n=1 Tax=Amblyomma triste TaxID=251400 RepID=A0A023G040_AMBTT
MRVVLRSFAVTSNPQILLALQTLNAVFCEEELWRHYGQLRLESKPLARKEAGTKEKVLHTLLVPRIHCSARKLAGRIARCYQVPYRN